MRPHPHPDDLRRFNELEPELRGEVLGHVAGCAECRERFLAPDPSRAFALLSLAVVPEETLDRLSRNVAERTAPRSRSMFVSIMRNAISAWESMFDRSRPFCGTAAKGITKSRSRPRSS